MTAFDPARASVAVVGPGAVGTFFAAQLAASGRRVFACARRRFDRYLVDSDTAPTDTQAVCAIEPGELETLGLSGPADLVIVTVKAFQTEGTAPWLATLCGPETVVVGAQNGVEEVERLTPLVTGARVLPSVVYCGSELLAPGHIRHDQHGVLIVPDDEAGQTVAPLFAGTGATWRPDPGFTTEAWRKLGINVMANGLTALTRRTMETIADHPVDAIAHDLLRECWTVGRAEGAEVGPADADAFDLSLLPAQGTSMYYDVMAERPTEFDALHGAVLRTGAAHGIATPVTAVVHALLAGREA